MAVAPQSLLNKVDLSQSDEGLIIGLLLITCLWITLTLFEKYGKRIGALIAQSIKTPLIIGFSSALCIGWLMNLVGAETQNQLQILKALPENSSTVFMVLVEIALALATIRLGKALLRKSSRLNQLIRTEDPKDSAMLIALLDRVFTIVVIVVTVAALTVTFGLPFTALGALLGGATIGLGFGTQQISQNFFSGFMIFFSRPFSVGDWISAANLEGTVEQIGWYHTRIRTFDRRPLFIPNSLFATHPIENPGRMHNRRIKASISLRYEDLARIQVITTDVRNLLLNHPEIDQEQSILVNFNEWDSSSINMMVYCFTKTTVWKEWLDIQQEVFLQIADTVQKAGADFAFPSTTLYPAPSMSDNMKKSITPD